MNKIAALKIRKIAIFRALYIGDLLCAIPAIRALKNSCPQLEITLIGLPWAEDFVKRFPNYFTAFIPFPGMPGIEEQPFNLQKYMHFLERVTYENFQLIVQIHGNGSIINPMIGMLGANRVAGYYESGRYCPDEAFCMIYPEKLSEVEKHLKLIEHLGISSQGSHLELPIMDTEQQAYNKLSKVYGLVPKKYVCIHPGARDSKRWWSPEKFASVANVIYEKGYKVVLTGTEEERGIVKDVERLMQYPAVNCVGQTNLGMMAALIKNAKMLLSNDTGVSHIAAAVQTPSVIIFLSSDPQRWAPLNKKLHQVILPHQSQSINHVLLKATHMLHLKEPATLLKKHTLMTK